MPGQVEPRHVPEIQRGDPRVRRQAVLIVVCGTLAGMTLLWLAESYRPSLEAWVRSDPDRMPSRLRLLTLLLASAVTLPVLGIAAYFWRLGRRTVRAQRFPPPGVSVMRDALVQTGNLARRRGRLMQLGGMLLLAAAFGFAIVLWRFVSLLDARLR